LYHRLVAGLLIEKGILDELSTAEIEALAPVDSKNTLVSRLRDGSSVTLGKQFVISALQRLIDECQTEDIDSITVNNFSVDKTINILVLTDVSTEKLGRKFGDALENDGWQVSSHVMVDRTRSGEEPPEAAAEEMLNYELVFCLTKHSLTHTVARKNANAKGISVITMPGITEDIFLNGAMAVDYSVVEQETNEMTARLTAAKKVTIRTGGQHELVIPIEGRDGVPSTGVFREKGASGNLP